MDPYNSPLAKRSALASWYEMSKVVPPAYGLCRYTSCPAGLRARGILTNHNRVERYRREAQRYVAL